MEELYLKWITFDDGEEVIDADIIVTKGTLKYYLRILPSDSYKLVSIN